MVRLEAPTVDQMCIPWLITTLYYPKTRRDISYSLNRWPDSTFKMLYMYRHFARNKPELR